MFEVLSAALVFGTIWFWVISAAMFILVLALSENEHNFSAFISVAAFIGVMEVVGTFNIFDDPLTLLKWGAVYFAVGAAWSFLKWFSLLNKKKDELMKVKQKWLNYTEGKGVVKNLPSVSEPVPCELWTSFFDYVKHSDYRPNKETRVYASFDPMKPTDLVPDWVLYKEKLVGWILWWPTSAFWTILNDPLVRLAEFIYSRFQGVYKKMASKVFSGAGI